MIIKTSINIIICICIRIIIFFILFYSLFYVMLRKYSSCRKFNPVLTYSREAMAGDTTTELLFLDTFKHQSAEVLFLTVFHPLVF